MNRSKRAVRFGLIIFTFVFAVIGMVSSTYAASGEKSLPLEYNAEGRAVAKAYYYNLRHCLQFTYIDGHEDYGVDFMTVLGALQGGFVPDGADGEPIGELTDDFLNIVIGGGGDDLSCTSGYLLGGAFDYFHTVTGNGKSWGEYTLEDKQEFFCSSGIFSMWHDDVGSNTQFNENECKTNVATIQNNPQYAGGEEFAFILTKDGLDKFDDYIKKQFFSGKNNIDLSEYKNDELYYVNENILRGYCSENGKYGYIDTEIIGDDDYAKIVLIEDKGDYVIAKNKYAYVDGDLATPSMAIRGTVIDTIAALWTMPIEWYKHASCESIASDISSLEKPIPKAALDTLTKAKREDCLNEYTEYAVKQQVYYDQTMRKSFGIPNGASVPEKEANSWDNEYGYGKWYRENIQGKLYPDDELASRIFGASDSDADGAQLFTCRLNDYISTLNNPDPNAPGYDGYVAPTNPGEIGDDFGYGGDNPACYSNSGSLGWIICPVIQAASGVGEHMWTQIEEYHMKIPASQIFEENGGVRQVWSKMRDFANIVFVILFLIVIFSQLTGFGIDNYGIKRILPKLILVAIVVNLSYFICELAVDISNIFGIGLNNLMTDAANQIGHGEAASGGAVASGWAVLAILGAGGVTLFTIFSVMGGGGVLMWAGLAVLGIIITIVVSMLVLYLTLIIREAGIILLTALSPLAFVCYALPNTDKYFKKWLEAFKALVVVYPICGLMIGLGQLAGSVLSSIDAESMKLAAAIIQVIPFFFIPTVLRKSMSMMGNVGAKLSSMGNRFSSRASGSLKAGIKNTTRYKDWQQYQRDKGLTRRSQRIMRRLGGRTNLSVRQQDKLAKARDSVLADNARRLENDRKSNVNYYDRTMNEQTLAREKNRTQDLMMSTDRYLKSQQSKQRIERAAEQRNMRQLNNNDFVNNRIAAMEEDERKQESKDRAAEMMRSSEYRTMGIEQLQQRWESAFRAGDEKLLEAITNVMSARYGTSAAGKIGDSLSKMTGIAQNQKYQASMSALQRVMEDNTAFAGNMKNKASDAFAMISNGGRAYNKATDSMEFRDLEHFSKDNHISTDIKDWSTQSAGTLRRAIKAGALKEDDIKAILNSTDPSVQSGIQSDKDKRDVLQAALYNNAHNPGGRMGPNPSDKYAADQWRQEQARAQAQAASAPTIRSSGAYRARGGGVVQLHEMSDGTFIDAANGQTVDIRRYKKQ